MKKLIVFLLLSILVLFSVSCSVSFPGKTPESGFFYCEELKTGIDFDLHMTTRQMIKVYDDYGNVQTHGCHFDYGSGVHFCIGPDEGPCEEYFYGFFKYYEKEKRFTITSHPEGITYTFVEQERKEE